MALFISLALTFALSTTTSLAQQKTKVAGKMTLAYTKQETMNIEDTAGHNMSLGQSDGTNISVGTHKFMDSAQVVNISFGDLAQGNGPHQGYVKFAKQADTTFAKWQGKVTTTLSPEGSPITTFEGTFAWMKGIGQFANIQGSGTYKGKFVSQTTYTVEWEGEYSIKK
jgi:hypothetical protein